MAATRSPKTFPAKSLTGALVKVFREARAKAGLTQETLAAKSGYDRTFIGLLEAGQRTPTLGSFIDLAMSLGVPASTLLRRIEKHIDELNTEGQEDHKEMAPPSVDEPLRKAPAYKS